MSSTSGICRALATVFVIAFVPAPAVAHMGAVLTVSDIDRVISGQTCETSNHATFKFGADGTYSYEGLWHAVGNYRVKRGLILVTFDSGLERAFSISKVNGDLYIEATKINCSRRGPGAELG